MITEYLPFFGSLISLNIMISRSIILWQMEEFHSFLRLITVFLCMCVCVCVYIYLNIGVQIPFELVVLFSLDIYPEMELVKKKW